MAGRRGETKLVLSNGREVALLFNMDAISKAEKATGRSLFTMLRAENLGVTEVAAYIVAGANAVNPKNFKKVMNTAKAYKVIDDVGLMTALQVVIEALSALIAPPETEEELGKEREEEDDDELEDGDDDLNL